MAISSVKVVTHLGFGERPQYATPYPEGIAVSHHDVTGDLSGGNIVFSILASPGFLYRYEMVRGNLDVDVAEDWDLILTHAWATDRSGLGDGAFNINHIMFRSVGSGAEVQLEPDISGGRYDHMHRFPIGSIAAGVPQLIAQVTVPTNTNTRVYDLNTVWTYWRKEAMHLPGFLSSFFEAPAVPPLLRTLT